MTWEMQTSKSVRGEGFSGGVCWIQSVHSWDPPDSDSGDTSCVTLGG